MSSADGPDAAAGYALWEKQHQQHVAEITTTLTSILSTFNEIHVCCSGTTCLAKLSELYDNSKTQSPTIVLIDIPHDQEQQLKRRSREHRTPSPSAARAVANMTSDYFAPDDIYGLHFLTHVSAAIHNNKLSKLVVPVVVLSGFDRNRPSLNPSSPALRGSQVLKESMRLTRYLDAGAVDVLISPMSRDNVQALAVHAYRVFKEATRDESAFLANRRSRKLSWVGVDEEKPYAYLREAMVSSLMSGICNPDMAGEVYDPTDVEIEPERQAAVAAAVGTWSFSAHDFSDDELLHGSLAMLEHALAVPELAKWRMSTDDLTRFLLASRAAYNDFVLYHNFRHVVDVLQAIFYFLVQIGSLPPYPAGAPTPKTPRSAVAGLVTPFDAFTLLISSIGHDVGHPGVNNAFLVALNAPLAQLYNDRSVLESFHCAAYSQILRRHWPAAFEDIKMRKLMINSILATDMGLHFKYMADLGNLQDKLHHNNNSLDGWKLKQLEEYRDLACGLLIKCADISNVARKYNVAAQWASILNDEFSNQGNMEKELNIPTQLFGGPPELDNIVRMAESQIGFMNIFARPLFEGVTDILPAMRFSVDELISNRNTWEGRIEKEKSRLARQLGVQSAQLDGAASPMTRSQTNLPAQVKTDSVAVSMTALSPVSPKSRPPEVDETGSSRGSANGSTTAGPLHPETPIPLAERRKATNGAGQNGTNLTPISSKRIRSISPSKRKKPSPEKPDKGDDKGGRPHSSPARSHTRTNVDSTQQPPLPLRDFSAQSRPRKESSDADDHKDSHDRDMNGALESPSASSVEVKGKGYLSSLLSNSATDLRAAATGKRTSRFGFPRLWRRKWRAASASTGTVPLRDMSEEAIS